MDFLLGRTQPTVVGFQKSSSSSTSPEPGFKQVDEETRLALEQELASWGGGDLECLLDGEVVFFW